MTFVYSFLFSFQGEGEVEGMNAVQVSQQEEAEVWLLEWAGRDLQLVMTS